MVDNRWFVGGWLVLAACEPPPVVDLAATDLEAHFLVLDLEEAPSDGSVIASVQFFDGSQVVQLDGSAASVTCNGVSLGWNGLLGAHAERVPLEAVGGSYDFVHSRAGVDTPLSLTAPARPVLLAPNDGGATLTISAALDVVYGADGGAAVRAGAGDGSTGLSGGEQSDDGVYEGLDVSDLVAGPGTLSLTRIFEDSPSGTGFSSAQTQYEVGADVAVTWQ